MIYNATSINNNIVIKRKEPPSFWNKNIDIYVNEDTGKNHKFIRYSSRK